jgi:hypothetical protein
MISHWFLVGKGRRILNSLLKELWILSFDTGFSKD